MAHLALALLGSFAATRDGEPISDFATDKVRALLAYLVVEAGLPRRRDALAELLWPGQPPRVARTNLRQALATLRTAIGDTGAGSPFFLITRETVQFNRASDHGLDEAAFSALLSACERHAHSQLETCTPCARRLEQAITLYRGNFLADVMVRDSAVFEEWVLLKRERLQHRALHALACLATYYERRGAYTHAERYAWRQIEIDPWHEAAHRQLIRILVSTGQRGAALRQYEICHRILEVELGVEPAPETIALAEQIRAGTFVAPCRRLPSRALPVQPTSFVGRERETGVLSSRLTECGRRLLTLVGAPGIGKTRLATEVAAQVGLDFTDGVAFIALAPVGDPALVGAAIAQVLGVQERGAEPLIERLKVYLHGKHLLLVLDNFEHVLAAAPLVAELLAAAPRLTVMATSRAPLRLLGEQEFAVAPLPVPDRRALPEAEAVTAYAAVALFCQRAQAVDPAFRLTAANAAAVAAICVQLDGLPLAIELAVARSRLLPPTALLRRLVQRGSGRLALLTGGARDAPARQQTLRNTIDWSYNLLTEPEQMLFRRCAVFAGGWTLEGIEAVVGGQWSVISDQESGVGNRQTPGVGAGATKEERAHGMGRSRGHGRMAPPVMDHQPPATVLDGLQALVEQSLVQRTEIADGEPRFTLLETLREYAWERLAAHGELAEVQTRHAAYYLALAEAGETELCGQRQLTWLDRFEREHDNQRAALGWMLEQNEVAAGLRLGAALRWFWIMRGSPSEGRRWLKMFLARSDQQHIPAMTRADALFVAGDLAGLQDDAAGAIALLEPALQLYRSSGSPQGVPRVLHELGRAVGRHGDTARGAVLLDESLARYHALGDRRGIAEVLLTRANVTGHWDGDIDQAVTMVEESLRLFREVGDRRGTADALGTLGWWLHDRGDLERGAALMEEALGLARELGDTTGIIDTLFHGGVIAYRRGDFARARLLLEEALELERTWGSSQDGATALLQLAVTARYAGDLEQAQALLEEVVELMRQPAAPFRIALIQRYQADVAYDQGDVDRAARLYTESLAIVRDLGAKWDCAACIEGLAAVAGTTARAVRLWSSAGAIREAIGLPLPPVDRPKQDSTLARLCNALGARSLETLWAEGRAMTLEQAIAYALDARASC